MKHISVQASEPFFKVLADFAINDIDNFEEKVREVLLRLRLRRSKTGDFIKNILIVRNCFIQ